MTGPSRAARTRATRRPLIVGAACIFGGEALCILGPLRHEHVVHVACHAVLYTGVALVGLGAAIHLMAGRRSPRR